mgnify:CR=1 FL=1
MFITNVRALIDLLKNYSKTIFASFPCLLASIKDKQRVDKQAFHVFKYINIWLKRVQHSLSTFYAYMSTCFSRDFPCSQRLAKKQRKCMKFWFLIRFTSCLRISRWREAIQKKTVLRNHRHSVERKIEKRCENKPAMLIFKNSI